MPENFDRILVLIKATGVSEGDVTAIKQRYVDAGLTVAKEDYRIFKMQEAIEFPGLVPVMNGSEYLVLLIEGPDAINTVRQLNAVLDPHTIHSSHSPADAAREAVVVFGKSITTENNFVDWLRRAGQPVPPRDSEAFRHALEHWHDREAS